MEGLGEIRYERAVKSLTDGFAYYKRGVLAFGALDTLARIGHASSAPLFRSALRSGDSRFRRAAVDGLARSGDKDAASLLTPMETSERDASVVLAIAFWRHRSGQSQQLSRLVQALGDPDLRVQSQDYLVELGPSAAPELAGQLGAAVPEARIALLEVLGVTGRGTQAHAVEAFQNDGDARVAAAAARTLARIRLRN
jgi:HEAT repeat protein